MAGHVQDRWYKTVKNPDGTKTREKTERCVTGDRYCVRYTGPDGSEKSKSFPDRQKRKAEEWLANIEADMSRGECLDPRVGRTTFREYATRWLASQTTDIGQTASVFLDAGENIKVLSNHLGHADPGFTFRVYTHLMPSSHGRARKAVDSTYSATEESSDGPEAAQA